MELIKADDIPEIQNLKQKADLDKVLLETEKLRKDLLTYEERFDVEKKKVYSDRNRFWAETVRLLGISLISGLITYFINRATEEQKKINTMQAQEHKLFSERRDKIFDNKNNEDRGNAACNLFENYKATNIENIKSDLIEVKQICDDNKVIEEDQKNIDKKNEEIKEIVGVAVIDSINKTEKEKKEIEELAKVAKGKDRIALTKKQDELENQLDSLIINNQALKPLSEATETITENIKEQALVINQVGSKKNNEKISQLGYPKTSWFKEGYFLIFDDMKIVLNVLSKDQILFSLCASTSPVECQDKIETDFDYINFTTPLKFSRNGFDYTISLERIGSAGKNPFKKAAYLTFEKY